MKRIIYTLVIFISSLSVHAASGFPCSAWLNLTESQKGELIKAVMSLAKKDGTTITKSPSYYVGEMNALIEVYKKADDQTALATSFGVAFRTVAVMDSDWDDGRDPIVIAKAQMKNDFETFTKLYPEKYKAMLKKSEEWKKKKADPTNRRFSKELKKNKKERFTHGFEE